MATTAADMTEGCRKMATRIAQAEADFLSLLMEFGGLATDAEARAALATFRKVRAIKLDAVNGRVNVKHGAFLERDVIRRAAEVA